MERLDSIARCSYSILESNGGLIAYERNNLFFLKMNNMMFKKVGKWIEKMHEFERVMEFQKVEYIILIIL